MRPLAARMGPAALPRRALWITIAIGFAAFALLWLLNAPYRQVYQPSHDDVTALADGLLLLPGAHWQDWFTRGHSDFFDTYPEWPQHDTAFSRPVFQFVIYLAHFAFGRNWASYLAINYIAIAGTAAVAFAIARAALGLGVLPSMLAAALTLLSSAVLEFSFGVLGAGSECLAAFLVGCGFLAVVSRRNALCALLLMLALLTKETAMWAPFAASLTVLLRRGGGRSSGRAIAAASMLSPIIVWLGMRMAFYGGIGGTYATADYTPLTTFLELGLLKLRHFHHLFIAQIVAKSDWQSPVMDRTIRIGAAVLFFLLLIHWALSVFRRARNELASARDDSRWPVVDASMLVAIWALAALTFYFALAVSSPRYAAAAVMFAWPSIVGEVVRGRSRGLRAALAGCLAISIAQTSQLLAKSNPPSLESEQGKFLRAAAAMNATLRQTPPSVREVYVLSTGGLVPANSEYLSGFAGIQAKIVRIVDAAWECGDKPVAIEYDHEVIDGQVTLAARLPDCARFFFAFSGIAASALVNGGIRRSESISYEFPEVRVVARTGSPAAGIELGHRMIARIRLHGPARFVVERGAPGGDIDWFDVP
jgi:hypothetical protein